MILKKLTQLGDKLWTCTSIIGGVFLIFYMSLTIANIVMRRFLNSPIFGVTELICYGSLAACCFGLAQTEWKDGNVTMTILVEQTSEKVGHLIRAINTLISVCGFAFVTYHCVQQVFIKYESGGGTTDLHIPLYIITIFLAVGFAFLFLCLVMKFILQIALFMEACKEHPAGSADAAD